MPPDWYHKTHGPSPHGSCLAILRLWLVPVHYPLRLPGGACGPYSHFTDGETETTATHCLEDLFWLKKVWRSEGQ